ncbi:hypothetical protein EC988_010375, partial [Linderina pennispora]
MRIGTVTYNLAQRRPSETALRALVQGAGAADVFIVAVQEHSDFLEAMRFRRASQYSANFAHILRGLSAALPSMHCVAAVEHGAQGLAVYQRMPSAQQIATTAINKASTGPWLTSSKGGIGVCLRVREGSATMSLAVVAAHLAAGMAAG